MNKMYLRSRWVHQRNWKSNLQIVVAAQVVVFLQEAGLLQKETLSVLISGVEPRNQS